jgi:predicted transcriptional regulator
MTMPSSTPPVTVRLSDALRADVDRLAAMTKRSRSYIINEALEQYLSGQIAYLQDLDAAVESLDGQPTHDAEAVFSWMRGWGSDDALPASEVFPAPNPSRQ